MDTLDYILKKYNCNGNKSPIPLNISRFKEFPKLLKELGFKKGAEIGVANGRFSLFLCKMISGLKLYCIDPWLAYGEYVEHHDSEGQKILDGCYEVAKQRLTSYDCKLIRTSSMDAVKDFEDNSLDFVFIDGNHTFQYVVNDIAEWSKKVKIGGIVSGHDFWRSVQNTKIMPELTNPKERIKLCQVRDAVESWTYANKINPWFVIKGDRCPSWMWVKE